MDIWQDEEQMKKIYGRTYETPKQSGDVDIVFRHPETRCGFCNGARRQVGPLTRFCNYCLEIFASLHCNHCNVSLPLLKVNYACESCLDAITCLGYVKPCLFTWNHFYIHYISFLPHFVKIIDKILNKISICVLTFFPLLIQFRANVYPGRKLS
jgi:hypothetical protein